MSTARGLLSYRVSSAMLLDANPPLRRLLYTFTALSGFIAIQIMHLALHDLKLNVAMTCGLFGGFLYSYLLAPKWRGATVYWVSVTSVGVALYFYLKIKGEFTMIGPYLGILAGVLMVLLAFKAFNPGDHRFILMFGAIFLLFSAVASHDIKFMLLLPMFLFFSGCSLYLANQVDVSLRVEGTTKERLKLDVGLGTGFASVLVKAVVGIILLATLGYIITPHHEGVHSSVILNTAPQVDPAEENQVERDIQPGLGGGQAGESAEVGLSDDFDLRGSSSLSTNPKPVLRMRSHKSGYLRAIVYDVYTGAGWKESKELMDVERPDQERAAFSEFNDEIQNFKIPLIDFPSGSFAEELEEREGIKVIEGNIDSNLEGDLDYDIVRQEITLLAPQDPYYFAMYQPFMLGNISLGTDNRRIDWPQYNDAAIVKGDRPDNQHPENFTYTVYSLEPKISKAKLEEVVGHPKEGIFKRYTQLPLAAEPTQAELLGIMVPHEEYRPISQRLKNFAASFNVAEEREGVSGSSHVWETVSRIIDYLTDENEFTYTRNYREIESELEITEAFCLGTKEGYCRYFASSMAVLCRMNDIPARVVKGYSPGSFSLIDNAYLYRASNAHVWCEVYFNGYGWIMFDPTPSASGPTNKGGVNQFITNVLDFLQEMFIIDPASTREAIWLSLQSAWAFLKANGRAAVTYGALLITLFVLFWLLRRVRVSQRQQRILAENKVVASYLDVRRRLGQVGVAQRRSLTARAVFTEAGARFPAISDDLSGLLPLYEFAAFSSTAPGEDDIEQARELAKKISAFLAQLNKSKK